MLEEAVGASITSSTALPTAIASGLPPKVEPCVPAVMPLAASAVARQAPTGKPPPSAFATVMMSGVNAGVLIGEQVAGAADAGLDLVENQQAGRGRRTACASARKKVVRHHAHAALAHDRLDQDGGGLRPDRFLDRFKIAERHLVEAVDRRAEAFEIFLVAGRGDRGQRAAVEGAFEGDDAVTLRLAAWPN